MTEDSQEIELRDNAEEAVRLIDDRKGVEAVEAALTADRSLGQIEIRRVEFVGPQVGRDLQIQAVYVVIAGIIAILAYIAHFGHRDHSDRSIVISEIGGS